MNDLDLSRLDKGELRSLVEEILGEGRICCTPSTLARARWKAAGARARRLIEIMEMELRSYLDAYQREKEALEAHRSSARLTKATADAQIAWNRAKKTADEAILLEDRRWSELQATWDVKGAAR